MAGDPTNPAEPPPGTDSQRLSLNGAGVLPNDLRKAHRQILSLLERQRRLEHRIEELSRIATTDELTSLRNRRYFRQDLDAAFGRARVEQTAFSLIILDVDRFKSYNDTYGHQSGDRVLMVVAGLLRQHADGADLAIRLGGEEFALLLPGADESRSLGIAEVIRKSVERFRWPQGSITASLGISTLRPCTEQATELVEEADVALYYSKSRGRNRAAHYRELVRLSRAGRSKPVIIPADRLVSRRRLRDFPV